MFLERANEMRAEQGKDYQIVVGDVEFRKGDMFMYCDAITERHTIPAAMQNAACMPRALCFPEVCRFEFGVCFPAFVIS